MFLVLASRQCWKWAKNIIFEESHKILWPEKLGHHFSIFNVCVYNFRTRWDDDVTFGVMVAFVDHEILGGVVTTPLSFWDACTILRILYLQVSQKFAKCEILSSFIPKIWKTSRKLKKKKWSKSQIHQNNSWDN